MEMLTARQDMSMTWSPQGLPSQVTASTGQGTLPKGWETITSSKVGNPSIVSSPTPLSTFKLLNLFPVLKSGGFKISALDIEREIMDHPKVSEAIVVGVDDPEYGQRIATAIVLKEVCCLWNRSR